MVKRLFVSVLAALFCSAALSFATNLSGFIPDSTTTLTKAKSMTAFLYNSKLGYNYILPLDISSADWTCPDSVWIEAIYVARFTNVKFKLRSSDTLTFPIDSLCGLPFDVTTVYKTGTDSLSRINKIFLIGRKR